MPRNYIYSLTASHFDRSRLINMGLKAFREVLKLPKGQRGVGTWIVLVENLVPRKKQGQVLETSQWLYTKLMPTSDFTFINIS